MLAQLEKSAITHLKISAKEIFANRAFDALSQDEDYYALSQFVANLEIIGALTTAEFCWNIGQSYDFRRRGEIGRLILSSNTLGSALKTLIKYYPLIQDNTSLTLDVGDKWTSLTYKILDPLIWPRHHDAIYSLGVYCALIKKAAIDSWPDIEIIFEASSQGHRSKVSHLAGAKCQFNGDANVIHFPSNILTRKLALASPPSDAIIKKLNARLVRKKYNTPYHIRVKNMIMERLEYKDIRQETIARELGVSGRTLNRHLVSEGYAFQQILDSCRLQLADLEFRRNNNISISQLALKLGFAEHSTFSRAFARWTGQSPQSYRTKLQGSLSA